MISKALAITLAAVPAVLGAAYQVQVAPGGQLIFDPSTVTAVAGDLVTFAFNPANHTLTQSTFAAPCTPSSGGVDSGFKPVSAQDSGEPVTYEILVNDTNPLWFFCKQGNHCSQGMVFAVNPPSSGNTFDAFKTAAMGTTGGSSSGGSSGSGSSASGSGSAPKPSGSGSSGSSGAVSAHGFGLFGITGLVASIAALII